MSTDGPAGSAPTESKVESPYREAPQPPAYKQASPQQIAGAAFFGTLVAAGVLLVRNRLRRGDVASARRVALGIAAAFVAEILVVAFSAFMRQEHEAFRGATWAVGIASYFACAAYAKRDATRYAAHLERGGKADSTGDVAVIAIGSLVVAFAVFFGAAMTPELLRTRVTIAPDQRVEVLAGASVADARKLGDQLKADGFFGDGGAKDVQIGRVDGAIVVGFVVREGAWDDPAMRGAFENVRREISLTFPATPIRVRLLDGKLHGRFDIEGPTYARLDLDGKHRVTFAAPVSDADAKKLAEYLVTIGWFAPAKPPSDVSMRREADLLVVSLVVVDGAWEKPESVAAFSEIRSAMAAKVFPDRHVSLELTDAHLHAQRRIDEE